MSYTINVCLSTSSYDVNYSLTWGTVELIGPYPVGDVHCNAGSSCQVHLPGFNLETLKSVLYYSDTASCTPTVGNPAQGLNNYHPSVRSPLSRSSPYEFTSMGIVDPSLTSAQQYTLTLCWASTQNLHLSPPVSVGRLVLNGLALADRNLAVVCHMGSACDITFPAGNQVGAMSIVNTPSTGCTITSIPVSWTGMAVQGTPAGAFKYSFGTPSEGNNFAVQNYPLCYIPDPSQTTKSVLQIGTVTMVGPTKSDTDFRCIAGAQCTLNLEGVWDSGTHYIELRENACTGALVSLQPNGGGITSGYPSGATTPGTFVSTLSLQIGPIGYSTFALQSRPDIVVCWKSSSTAGAATFIKVGTVSSHGPSPTHDPTVLVISCTLGYACEHELETEGTETQNEILYFVKNGIGVPQDSCMLGSGSQIIATGLGTHDPVLGSTVFKFPPIVIAPELSFNSDKIACWILDDPNSIAVPIGLVSIVGPPGDSSFVCYIGQPCTFYPSYNPQNSLFPIIDGRTIYFMTKTVADCLAARNTRILPDGIFNGLASGGASDKPFKNPAYMHDNLDGTYDVTFGILKGWKDTYPLTSRTFTLCYSGNGSPNVYRSTAVIGSVTISSPITITTTGTCYPTSSTCNVHLQSSSSLSSLQQLSNNAMRISPNLDCSLSAAAAFQHATVTVTPASPWTTGDVQIDFDYHAYSQTRTSYICILDFNEWLNFGPMPNLIGPLVVLGGPNHDQQPICYKGASTCEFQVSYGASIPATMNFKLSASKTNCVNDLDLKPTGDPGTATSHASFTFTDLGNGIGKVSTNQGIGQVAVADSEFAICAQIDANVAFFVIGTIQLIGPFWGQQLHYEVASDTDMIYAASQGLFNDVSAIGLVQPTQGSNLGNHPCYSFIPTQVGTGIMDTQGIGSFPLGIWPSPADIAEYDICWKSQTSTPQSNHYIPGGTLQITGPITLNYGTNPTLCTVGQDCIVNGGVKYSTSQQWAAISSGINCDAEHEILSCAKSTVPDGSGNLQYNFGPNIRLDNPTRIHAICWAHSYDGKATSLASFPVLIGYIKLKNVRCDPIAFLGVSDATVDTFSKSIASGSLDPRCDVEYTAVSGTSVNQPVVHFAIQMKDSLPSGYLTGIISSPLGTLDPNEHDASGNTILKLMISGGISGDDIYETIAQMTIKSRGYVPSDDEIYSAISHGRDDVMVRVLLPRMSITQIQSRLVEMVSNKLVNSLEIALERGADPSTTLAFHEAIAVNEPNLFRMLLSKCCDVHACVGTTTDGLGHTARDLATPGSPYLTTINDATLTQRGCI